jgi:hypothetical protein
MGARLSSQFFLLFKPKARVCSGKMAEDGLKCYLSSSYSYLGRVICFLHCYWSLVLGVLERVTEPDLGKPEVWAGVLKHPDTIYTTC